MTNSRKGSTGLIANFSRLVTVAAISVLWLNISHSAQLVWIGDFESGLASIDGTSDADFQEKLYDPGINADADVQTIGGMSICGAPREGLYAGRNRILEAGSGVRVRAEVLSHVPGAFKFDWDGPEYWVGVSLCLAQWPQGSDVHTFFQIHAPNEVKGSTCDFAGNALAIDVSGDTGKILVIDNPSGISEGSGSNSNSKEVYNYNLRNTMGQWQDFVFRFHLSTRGTGYYTAWHNGRQVASESGLVNVNWKDSCGQVISSTNSSGLHVGIYGGPNNAGPKTIYIDSAKIAEGSNGYDLVSPGGPPESRPEAPSGLTASP